jgi:HAT1-interacting factor 1
VSVDGHDRGQDEDDFNVAWEVIDLARALYEKQMDGNEMRLKSTDIFTMLGGISLETGALYIQPPLFPSCLRRAPELCLCLLTTVRKFDQAITDYNSGLTLKMEGLPLLFRLQRSITKVSIALDSTAGRLADSIHHAQRAIESIEACLVELQAGLTSWACCRHYCPNYPNPPTRTARARARMLHSFGARLELERGTHRSRD